MDEALVVGCVSDKRKVSFACNCFWLLCASAGGGFELSGYTSDQAMVVLNEGFQEWDRWCCPAVWIFTTAAMLEIKAFKSSIL